MLALTIAGSGVMRTLALRAYTPDDWRPAVYRYPADGMPDCADLAGRVPVRPALRGHWSRMVLPDTPQRSPQGCLLRERRLA